MRLSTRLVTGPKQADGEGQSPSNRGCSPPIERSTTFALDEAADEALRSRDGISRMDVYGRFGTSTVREAARLVAEVEGGEAGLVFSSGMAAIAASFTALVPANGRIAVADAVYGGTQDLLDDDLPSRGIEVRRFDATDPDSLARAVEGGIDLVWCESLDNPLVRPAALGELAALAHGAGGLLAVDSTFAGGIATRPLEFGADVVVHSATKFLNGHGDVIAGAAVGAETLVRRLYAVMTRHGSCLDPHAAWLLIRGLRTLPLRFRAQAVTARALAQRLVGDARAGAVHYPGLDAPLPDGFHSGGAVLSFDLGTEERARAFCFAVRLCMHATSLGGIETLVSSPVRSSHATVAPELRQAAGVTDGLVRVAVGLEHEDDLWTDFDRALRAVHKGVG